MKSFYRVCFCALIFILLYSCTSNVPVYQATNSVPAKGHKGFFYVLPKTQVNIDFVISRTEITKAKYADFAESMIGEKNEPDTTFKIEEINITNSAGADSTHWYFVDLHKHGLFKRVALTTETNEYGIISSGSSEVENKSVEFVADIVEFTAGVASKFIPFAGTSLGVSDLKSNSKKPSHESLIIYSLTKREKDSLAAIEVVAEIKKVKEQRMLLITNQTPHPISEGALQVMIKELDAKEQELLVLFVGKKKIAKIKLHFKTSVIADTQLFVFSDKLGISGFPAYMNVEPKFINGKGTGQPVSLKFHEQSRLPTAIKPDSLSPNASNDNSSFFYRIPVNSDVQIWKNNIILYETEFPIAQLGAVQSLPLKSGSLKSKYELKFDSKTGALLKITVNREPLSTDAIDKTQKASEKVIDLLKPNELSELEEKRKILEEKKKILDLEKELSN